MATEDCTSCRFWLHAEGEFLRARGAIVLGYADEPTGHGFCRRRAPIATGGMMSNPATMWPVTGEAEWCGDYEREALAQAEFAQVYACEHCHDGDFTPSDAVGEHADECPKCGASCIPF